MKKITVVFVLLVLVFSAFAGIYNTVPLDNEVYTILDAAQVRGLISPQSDVKPYSYSTVRDLLNQILNSDSISENETSEVLRVLDKLELRYGKTESTSAKDFFNNGLLRFNKNNNSFAVGVTGTISATAGLMKDDSISKIIDSRNIGTVYMSGDFFDCISFDMNASLLMDLPSSKAYLPNEFLYNCDGDYFLSFKFNRASKIDNVGDKLEHATAHSDFIFGGIKADPEITASFYDGDLTFRFGQFKRDWGPGTAGIVLSSYASTFPAVEIQAKPFDWMTFTVLTGSLERTVLDSVDGRLLPGYSDEKNNGKDVSYNSNYSMQRIEFTLPHDIKFSVFESVVWQKRLEFSYLNPVSIYWFAQTLTGDVDNLQGGFDISMTFANKAKVYAAFSIDEMTVDIKHLLTEARNIMAVQGGITMPASLLGSTFGTCTAQLTYVPSFYGCHYYTSDAQQGNIKYSPAYVNRGFALGYPVDPDTIELYASLNLNYKGGWSINATVKDQLSSAQYALVGYDGSVDYAQAGNNTLTQYDCHEWDYANKDFFGNFWKNVLDAKLQITKTFEDFPVELTGGLEAIAVMTRNYSVQTEAASSMKYNNGIRNKGYHTHVSESWNNPELRALGNIGFKLYY